MAFFRTGFVPVSFWSEIQLKGERTEKGPRTGLVPVWYSSEMFSSQFGSDLVF